ncbi:YjcZ family sporulation protein [Bacillus sp. V5-8f]|nr:YjcZ family sporulation protein [Bacillus sp. V5-8f]PLT32061.1 sporulation protein YjcZ [Bacillus sp. V5-8f]
MGKYTGDGCWNSGFAFLLVIFILLVITGCACYGGYAN